MRFASTRNPVLNVSLMEAAVSGFPRDGGLFVPTSDPDIRSLIYNLEGNLSYKELTSIAASALFDEEWDPLEMTRIMDSAYSFAPGLLTLDASTALVDLCTGPSGCFKDFGMAFLAALISNLPISRPRTILLATTGDTGAAAAEAFNGVEGIRLVLLYPAGPVRGIRPSLLARNGGFVEAVRVPGTLADSRHLVRQAFEEFGADLSLVPATSANVARLLAQVFYYLYAFISLRERSPGDFLVAIPSGNLGNLISGLYAWRWGVPITGFILTGAPGAESSEALIHYLFDPVSAEGAAPYEADDPENRERIRALAAGNPGVLRTLIYPTVLGEEESDRSMRHLYGKYGIFVGPETARTWASAEHVLDRYRLRGAVQVAVFADSHPAKHADAVERACGMRPEPLFPAYFDTFAPDAELSLDLDTLGAYLKRG